MISRVTVTRIYFLSLRLLDTPLLINEWWDEYLLLSADIANKVQTTVPVSSRRTPKMISLLSFRYWNWGFVFRLSPRALFSSVSARSPSTLRYCCKLIYFVFQDPNTCSSHSLFDSLDIISESLLLGVLAQNEFRARGAAGGHRCERSCRHNETADWNRWRLIQIHLPTWRRRPRDCRRYDAPRRSERRHLTARRLTNFAAAGFFKNIAAETHTLSPLRNYQVFKICK